MKRAVLSIFVMIVLCSPAFGDEQTLLHTGSINIQDGVTLLLLDKDRNKISVSQDSKSTCLTAGQYTIDSWTLNKKDSEGNSWQLKASYSKKPYIDIIAGRQVTPKIEESIIAAFKVRKQKSEYKFMLELKSCSGEKFTIHTNGKSSVPPRLVITNQDKTFNITKSFAYG